MTKITYDLSKWNDNLMKWEVIHTDVNQHTARVILKTKLAIPHQIGLWKCVENRTITTLQEMDIVEFLK